MREKNKATLKQGALVRAMFGDSTPEEIARQRELKKLGEALAGTTPNRVTQAWELRRQRRVRDERRRRNPTGYRFADWRRDQIKGALPERLGDTDKDDFVQAAEDAVGHYKAQPRAIPQHITLLDEIQVRHQGRVQREQYLGGAPNRIKKAARDLMDYLDSLSPEAHDRYGRDFLVVRRLARALNKPRLRGPQRSPQRLARLALIWNLYKAYHRIAGQQARGFLKVCDYVTAGARLKAVSKEELRAMRELLKGLNMPDNR